MNTKTGGPNGSIRNEEEYSHGSNNGLKIAIDFCGRCSLPISNLLCVLFFPLNLCLNLLCLYIWNYILELFMNDSIRAS